MLANMIQAELFDRLRLKMAVSYAPNVDAVALRGGSAWLEGTVDVDGQAAPQALTIVRGWFDRAQPFTIDPQGLRAPALAESAEQRAGERHQRKGGPARSSTHGTRAGRRRCSTITRAIWRRSRWTT